MRVLVFGGTWFIGKEIVRQSVEAGHDVTLFNRGATATDGAVRTLRGDIAKVLDHRDAIRAVRPDVVVPASATASRTPGMWTRCSPIRACT